MNTSQELQSAQSSNPSLLFQQANDLLELLGDPAIWTRLVNDGLDRDAQQQLRQQLAKSRNSYRSWRTVREAVQEPEQSSELALVTARDSNWTDTSELTRIVSTIRDAGSHLFYDTRSLRTRFAGTA